MHSGQFIKTSNHQGKLNLTGLRAGQELTLTPIGAEAGVNVKLPITEVTEDSVSVEGHKFNDYMGSLVSYLGKLHTLDLPAAA